MDGFALWRVPTILKLVQTSGCTGGTEITIAPVDKFSEHHFDMET